jgi:hypothetical protein
LNLLLVYRSFYNHAIYPNVYLLVLGSNYYLAVITNRDMLWIIDSNIWNIY